MHFLAQPPGQPMPLLSEIDICKYQTLLFPFPKSQLSNSAHVCPTKKPHPRPAVYVLPGYLRFESEVPRCAPCTHYSRVICSIAADLTEITRSSGATRHPSPSIAHRPAVNKDLTNSPTFICPAVTIQRECPKRALVRGHHSQELSEVHLEKLT